ncbi:MAG: hypothetical protein J0I63_09455 [Thiobacillus sp.]|nr:hypothetical protein [Thiobacillus sp.]
MRLFLDANILFTAAHNPQGKAALVIELGQAGLWQLVSSAYALEEARRNLALKFPDGLERLDALAQGLRMSPDAASRDDFGFLMNDRNKAGGLLVQTVADFLNT